MPANKVLYAVRMPVDLKRMIDQAAESGGVTTSQLVIAACWKYLERGNMPAGRTQMAQPMPTVKGNDAMQAFLAKLPAITPIEPEQTPLMRPCPKIGWDHPDGEPRKCRLQAGHKGNCSPGERMDA